MIPLPGVRDKGCPLLGAARPGEHGPFGEYGGGEDHDQDEDDGEP